MSNLFILGSTGYIGTQLLDYIKRHTEHKFYSAGRKNVDVLAELGGDVSKLVDAAKSSDVVVFLASISAPDVCANQAELAYKVNVTATLDLIHQLTEKGVKVIFSSTDLVFGKCDADAVVTDNSQLMPFGYYGEMKAEVERSVFNNPLVKVIRFSYVMGSGDKYTNMLLEMASENKELEVFDGFERNVVAVDDVVTGIYQLVNKWDDIIDNCINFSGPQLINRMDLTKLFSKYHCPNLKFRLAQAPDGFWNARPKTIQMNSYSFSGLLGKDPMSVEQKLKKWRKK